MPVLQFKSVQYTYEGKLPIYYDLIFSSEQPIALMGESGVGKTTLLNLIANFIYPQKGEILWENHTGNTNILPDVSYLMQDAPLFDYLTVQQNILFSRASLEDVLNIVHQLGLENILHQRAGDLSGGQRQRVLLAQTILQNRSIVLLDEPFQGLDMGNRLKAANVIKDLVSIPDQLLIFTTHEEEDIDFFNAHKVLI